jgi:hypothetical protein
VAGPDDLLLLLTQLWARDKSVFPTEDDRHDVATVMLFQAYTGSRLAEFVHVSKGKASQDPLGEAEVANKNERPPRGDEDDDLQYDDDSDAGDGPDYDDDIDYADDNEDDEGDDAVGDGDLSDGNADESADHDSGYNSDETDTPMTESGDDCYAVEADGPGEPGRQDCDDADLDEFGEAIRKYKALCYEDICL